MKARAAGHPTLMFRRPSEHCSFLPSFLHCQQKRRGSRKAEWDGKKSWTSDSVAVAVRGRWQRKQALSPAMKEREEGRKERGRMGGPACSLARSFAQAGNLSAGKNVPKALEHVEPLLTLAAASKDGETNRPLP